MYWLPPTFNPHHDNALKATREGPTGFAEKYNQAFNGDEVYCIGASKTVPSRRAGSLDTFSRTAFHSIDVKPYDKLPRFHAFMLAAVSIAAVVQPSVQLR